MIADHSVAAIAAIAEKNIQPIVAIIWKPLFSGRNDRFDRCDR